MQHLVEMLEKKVGVVLADLTVNQPEARDAGVNLMRVRGLLRNAFNSLACPKHWIAGIGVTKEACEELAKRAGQAVDNGDEEFAKLLVDHLDNLSPIVASLLPFIEKEIDAKAD